MNQIHIYCPVITNRLRYIANILLGDLLGLQVDFIADIDAFRQIEGYTINYSQQYISETSFWIPAHGLLFEKGVTEQVIEIIPEMELPNYLYVDRERAKLPFFFQVDGQADFPFDFFSMGFYLLSRYEEYLPYATDQHGRFPASSSLAYRENFLHLPLVDFWTFRLGEWLKHFYPTLLFAKPKYRFLPTIDVDMAWAFQNKGLLRIGGAFGKALLEGKHKELKQRLNVLIGNESDPFNSFLYLAKAHKKINTFPTFFFLMGKHGSYDKNIDPANPKFQKLIQTIAADNTIGMHPSYGSNSSREQLFAERQQLEKITNQSITKSRQHFLKLHLPSTYRNLIELGIQEDYSMGYAAANGFRASTASPFYWYDLEKEEATLLRIHPFQVMDVTLKEYLKYDLAKAKSAINDLIKTTKRAGGQFISIWHNSSFAVHDGWEGWEVVYEYLLEVGGDG